MRKIAIAAAVSLSLSGVSGISHALGLGEIEMYSALNQNLDAEIGILSATDDELRDMQVRLASATAFARAGLEQSPVLSTVSFAVDQRPDGKPVVKVTSDGPVVEPFLNFLIEVEAPGSVKLVREYTVLLDPAPFADSNKAAAPEASIASTSGGTAIDLAQTDIGTASTSEVSFSESRITTTASRPAAPDLTAPDLVVAQTIIEDSVVADAAPVEEPNLFIPDETPATSTLGSAGATVVDRNGVLISLEQELNTTPQFDETVSATSDATVSDEPAGNGDLIPLDNLGARVADASTADNAIFGDDFNNSTGGSVITGEELRELVGDAATTAGPTVEFTETSEIRSFEPETTQVAADLSTGTVADGEAGNLVDLSGIADELSSGSTATTTPATTIPVQNNTVAVSGRTYRIKSQDTLWRIANAEKERRTTPHQMMVALLNANQSAFVDGNMNRMRVGSVLQIPTAAAQTSVSPANALAIVLSWTRDNKPPPAGFNSGSVTNVVQPVVADNESEITIIDTRVDTPVNTVPDAPIVTSALDDVNSRYEAVREEIAAETMQRDELQGRVDSLTENMEQMKGLITVRENQLREMQTEVASAEDDAAAIDAQITKLASASDSVAEMQKNLSRDLTEAQSAVVRQADLEKNIASAEAEAQSVILASQEDSLRSQLAALEIEKRDLEATAQTEKAALLRQSELEKTRLLADAQAERDKIMADLEVEKARITREAELEVARIKSEADTMAAETAQMQTDLQTMEAEKTRLLQEAESKNAMLQQEAEEQARLTAEAEAESARVKDRLAKIQQQADDKAAEAKAAMAAVVDDADTDAEGMAEGAADKMADTSKSMVDTGKNMADAGKNMAAGGAAAVTGLLGSAPLQGMIGNRKNVLAAGAGLSLLGLLGAWAMRRRQPKELDDVRGLRPRGEAQPAAAPQARANNGPDYSPNNGDHSAATAGNQPGGNGAMQRSGGAAAAAAAAAAVTGTAAAVSVRGGSAGQEPVKAQSESVQTRAAQPQQQSNAPQRQETAQPASAAPVQPQPAPQPERQANPQPNSQIGSKDSALEEEALDDTITEAEVYLRYGLHGQAEDLLKTAIDRSPDNEEYHFKLLENYHDQKNGDDFSKAAETFRQKFPSSEHMSRLQEMGAELGGDFAHTDKGNADSGTGLGIAGAVAGAGALAAGAVATTKDAAADGMDSVKDALDLGADDQADDFLDQTIDPGEEFSVDELKATGNLGAMTDDVEDFGDADSMSLDDVDIASLDDDGTMNLEEIAGSQMSGGDLGSMDFTNTDGEMSFEDLGLEDSDIAPGGIAGDVSSGPESDSAVDGPMAAGGDEMETMLDLAKAYIDMGDNQNASKALKDIAARGNPLQQIEANELLKKLT